jgi:hypothetical protein
LAFGLRGKGRWRMIHKQDKLIEQMVDELMTPENLIIEQRIDGVWKEV